MHAYQPDRPALAPLVCLFAFLIGTAYAAEPAQLGAPNFMPTPEETVGFRGDGSGRYPGATPPIIWSRSKEGVTKNVVWAAPLPAGSVASPLVVGDKIFITGEVYDLACLEKKTGRYLWIRSSPEFEGLDEEERKATPAYAEVLAPLAAQLTQANAEVVEGLNAQFLGGKAGAAGPALGKKREIEKQIQAAEMAISAKLYGRDWRQAVFGFAGQTPASDGKHVCSFFTNGISVCYDLDGNRKWTHRGPGFASEHGNFTSPVICGNRFAVWAYEMRGYDVETGKTIWSFPASGSNTYGSMFKFKIGNDWVAAHQCGYFARASDGKKLFGDMIFGDSISTPIVENGVLFSNLGYPRVNGSGGGFFAYPIPASETGKFTPTYGFQGDWAADEIPVSEKKPFERGIVASPLCADGLIYRMTEAGGLMVNDAKTGAMVYRKVLPMQAITQYWTWAGASTSPTLAGKFIYLMDNQGTTVVIDTGRQYREVARNVIEEVWDGKNRVQNLTTPVFDGTRMYYKSPSFLYCIEGRPVPELLQNLKGDATARADACVELGAMGATVKEALPAVKACMNDTDLHVRVKASVAVQKLDPDNKTVFKLLTDLYRAEHDDVLRKEITEALQSFNRVPVLLLEYSGREADVFTFHSNTPLDSSSGAALGSYKLDAAKITHASVAPDGRTLTLTIPGIPDRKPQTLTYAGLHSVDGVPPMDPLTFTSYPNFFLHFKFNDTKDEIAHNAIAEGPNGAFKGGPKVIPGRKGSALSLSHEQSLEIPNSPEFQNLTKGDYTVAFWIKLNSPQNGAWRAILQKGNADLERCPAMYLHPDSNIVHFRISTNCAEKQEGGDSASPLKIGQWAHVAYVRERGTLRIYLDGVKTEAALNNEVASNSGALIIGKSPWYAGADCDLEDFRIYAKAFNDTEVTALAKE